MTVCVSGMGAVTCAGVGQQSMLAALERSSNYEQVMSQVSEDVVYYPLAEFDYLDCVSSFRLPEKLILRLRKSGNRNLKHIQSALLAVAEAWDQAKLSEYSVDPQRASLIVGGSNLSQAYQQEVSRVRPSHSLRFLDSDHIGNLSEAFCLRGEGYTTGGASASGNIAIINGARLIEHGLADVVLVVGALMALSPVEIEAFLKAGAMAENTRPQGMVNRPFDRDHSGFVYGQGCGCIILESRDSAKRRGVEILASLAGSAMMLHAHSSSAPSLEAEVMVMKKAVEQANVQVDTDNIYINAHGSGSPLGDTTEADAIHSLFKSNKNVLVNSSKSVLGHTLTAAGVLESIAVVHQLREKRIHATRNLFDPINGDVNFAQTTQDVVGVTYGLSNSFGFGGINSAILWSRSE